MTGAPVEIDVSCSCGEPIALNMVACPSCHTPVSRALAEELEARLEGAYPDYRETKDQLRRGAVMLLVLGLIHAAIGVLSYWLAADMGVAASDAMLVLGGYLLLTALYLGCAKAMARRPLAAMGTAALMWLGIWLLQGARDPASVLILFLSAKGIALLFALIAVFILMVRALFAARRLKALSRQLGR